MQEKTLLEAVDNDILIQFLKSARIQFAINMNVDKYFENISDYTGYVRLICNSKQIKDIRRFEAYCHMMNITLDNTDEAKILCFKILMSCSEYLNYKCDIDILTNELKKYLFRQEEEREEDQELLQQMINILIKINSKIFDKYKLFYESLYDSFDDENWNGVSFKII